MGLTLLGWSQGLLIPPLPPSPPSPQPQLGKCTFFSRIVHPVARLAIALDRLDYASFAVEQALLLGGHLKRCHISVLCTRSYSHLLLSGHHFFPVVFN